MRLSVNDLALARAALAENGPGAMYDLLAAKGDQYAVLANGVARGDSIAGVAAIHYMKSVAADAGVPMGDEQVEVIRRGMATAYLSALDARLVDGTLAGPLPQAEVAAFHRRVFEGNGYPASAWTLHSVFLAMPQDSKDAYWRHVLSAAGEPLKEAQLAFQTHVMMGQNCVLGPPEVRSAAREWINRVEAPAGWYDMAVAAFNSLFRPAPVTETLPDGEAQSPRSPLIIDIDTRRSSRREVQGLDDVRGDVAAGFVTRRLTHGIAFADATLANSDFVSAQKGSLATGGIRPGELQHDPNVRPSQYLADFYREGTQQADFSLRNAAVLNGLAAMTTLNTFVDPLLFDLGGQGVGMTGLEDPVLFDVDNSGSLRRTGWADRHTGLLVHDDGQGQVASMRQLFSEYYMGEPGQAPFNDGLAALASVDSNADGAITADDPVWASLKLWVDGNHDGRVDGGELQPPAVHGITRIGLRQVQPLAERRQGNEVIARSTFTVNGAEREVLAVRLVAERVSHQAEAHPAGTLLRTTSGSTTRRAFISGEGGATELDAAALGVDTVQGAGGDDTLKAAPGGSWLVGGAGSNTYLGGPGDDVLVISASDQQANLQGNGGDDSALIVGQHGVSLNMAEAGLSIAQGGRGRDIIASGGQRGVFIKGGSGDSLLIGGGGNDVLVGGTGRNIILGGSGRAVIYAGPSGDRIRAAAGGSIIHAGAGPDRITGSAADDVIEAGQGDALIDGAGGVDLVVLHGSHDEYLILRTEDGYRVTDRVMGRDGSLTLTDIHKLSFSDLAAVDLRAPAALPVSDTFTARQQAAFARQGASFVVPAAALLANDAPLGSQGPLRIAAVSDAHGATVNLNQQGDVQVTPLLQAATDIRFRYELVDAAGNRSMTVSTASGDAAAPLQAQVTLLHGQAPGDPLATRQWHLDALDVRPVWQDFSGKGVRIGQFEPGGEFAVAAQIFDIEHPDLKGNVDPAWLTTQRSEGRLPQVPSQHATQVAGVMVGMRNDQGGIGVSYEATLGGHYLANQGDDLTGLGQMVNYDIANHSWGFKHDFAVHNVLQGRVDDTLALVLSTSLAAANGRSGLGTVLVAAGGNQRDKGGSAQGSLINNSRHAIEVAAINARADLSLLQVASAPFSNPGASLLVAAPGSQVLSTGVSLRAERGAQVGSAYGLTQGTSLAAPMVSGVVALMLQANPRLGYRDVQQILAVCARQVDDRATAWQGNAGRSWNGGGMRASHDYGFGLVDARAAVRLAESWGWQASTANERQLSAGSAALDERILPGQVATFTLNMPGDVRVEHAEVDFYAVLGRLGDLTLALISPHGTRSVLLERAGKAPGSDDADAGSLRSGWFKHGLMSTHYRGEASAGDWRLEVGAAAKGLPLTLHRWTLRLVGSSSGRDDVYLYTDEYPHALAQDPRRQVLDDAANGGAGGRNTFNAAAVSGSVAVDLGSGIALLGGTPLTITPGSVHNLISGDGDDTLSAGAIGALLDGGRGSNLLRGGAGTDRYVIHRRAGGSDVIEQFDGAREVVDLVGFAGMGFADLRLRQEGSAVLALLGDGQTVRWPDLPPEALGPRHFRFLASVDSAPGYLTGDPEAALQLPTTHRVLLEGGGKGVSLELDEAGQWRAALDGILYRPAGAEPCVFVVVRQAQAMDYKNTVRGFRHGLDKIDLSQAGVRSYLDLQIDKDERFHLNGFAQIHGVSISTRDKGVKLLYLDALEVAQVRPGDFLFAQPT
ncbi:S8 family serine peptidase [Pseudomonas sp. NPDC089401]|uniref:S8 family serine peptidase n=1 Tax=Pseudomonas sp. NPDC089401 TaxID=3364462 RepID=UPI003825467B